MNAQRSRSRPTGLELPKRRIKLKESAVALWRPEIVLASKIDPVLHSPVVTLGAPVLRPQAVRAQLGTVRSMVSGLTETRQALTASAAAARVRAEQAGTARERVSAAIAAYRAEASLDDVLTGTLREVTALMEERGLR
jgi:hypothetical protein